MVLLRVELENNDEKIKFETHGILNKNKNTLIYDDNKTKTCIDFNNNIKQYISYIGGFHLWGKRKSQTGRWTSHNGNLNTFFSNNDLLKDEFINSVIGTFDDNMVRYFVPEVNSSEEDLQSIINDLLKYDIKFELED